MRSHDFLSWIFWTIGCFSFGFTARAIYNHLAENSVDFDMALQSGFILSVVAVITLVRDWALYRKGQPDNAIEEG